MKPRDAAAYVFLAVAWGFSFLVLLRVVEAFGWVGAVTLRAFVACAALALLAVLTRRRLNFNHGWRPLAVVGATTVAGQLVCLSVATPLIGTAMTAICIAAIPLFSMAIGQAWGLERITARGLVGLLLGVAGIVLLVGFPAEPVTVTFILGCAAALAGAFCSAFGSNYASRHLRGTGALEVTIGAFLAGGLLTLPLLLWVPVPAPPRLADLGLLLVLGGVMSGLCYMAYFRLVSAIGATRAVSVEFAVTVIATLVGAGLLGERLSAVQLLGAAIIVCGCALVLGLLPGRRRGRARA
ncbi:DMT family transporter [Azorhizobium doebereinerae]|uniref:DMT family transporter n=1 Tax=Azorhizobium doebereinerae TaxID=281091 RepID=UPI000413EF5B|nr:DMT family transporter [Azorhizobium doebereinerae]